MQYAVKDGQDIYDIIINTSGSIEGVYALILANPTITNIDFNFNQNPNVVVSFPAPPSKRPADVSIKNNVDDPTGVIVGREGQSLFDICAMTTNNIDNIYEDIILKNGISNANQTYLIGKSFSFDKTKIKDIGLYNYLRTKATSISTIDPAILTGKSFNKSFNKSYK